MNITELILEVSNAERKRRKDQAEKMKQAEILRQQQAAAAAANKAEIDSKRPKTAAAPAGPKNPFTTVAAKPAPEPVSFGGVEIDQSDVYDPKEDTPYGVILKFQQAVNPFTKQNTMYAYWSHGRGPNFEDCKKLGTISDVGKIYSTPLANLVDNLIKKEEYVHIEIDSNIVKQFAEEVAKLEKYVKNYQKKYGHDTLNIETLPEISYKDQFSKPAPVIKVKQAEKKIPNAKELETRLISLIRNDSDLFAKYKAADPAKRMQALKIGVSSLHSYNDDEEAVYDVDNALN